jgi:hypothetical protein
MFKRFEVIDLFHYTEELRELEPSEWIVDTLPKEKSGLYKVKLEDGSITIAYYCEDKCLSLMRGRASFSGNKILTISHWYERKTYNPLTIIAWGKGVKQKEESCSE